jgi:hypothetical protein
VAAGQVHRAVQAHQDKVTPVVQVQLQVAVVAGAQVPLAMLR